MALTNADLVTIFSRMARETADANLLARMLCSTTYQGEWDAGARTIKIPRDDTTLRVVDIARQRALNADSDIGDTSSTTDRADEIEAYVDNRYGNIEFTANGGWTLAELAYTDFTPDQEEGGGIGVDIRDERQTPIPLLAGAAMKLGRRMAEEVDTYLFQDIMHTNINANSGAKYHTVALGASKYPGSTTRATAKAGGQGLMDALRILKGTLAANEVAFLPGLPSNVWAVFHPLMIQDLEAAMTSTDQTWEQIGAPTQRNGWVGRLFGIDIYVSNNIETTVSGTNTTNIYAPVGLRSATEFVYRVDRESYISADMNQNDWVSGRYIFVQSYGAIVLHGSQLRGIRYKSGT